MRSYEPCEIWGLSHNYQDQMDMVKTQALAAFTLNIDGQQVQFRRFQRKYSGFLTLHCGYWIMSQSIYIWWPTHIDVRTRMYKKHWWFERVIECQTWVTVSKQRTTPDHSPHDSWTEPFRRPFMSMVQHKKCTSKWTTPDHSHTLAMCMPVWTGRRVSKSVEEECPPLQLISYL